MNAPHDQPTMPNPALRPGPARRNDARPPAQPAIQRPYLPPAPHATPHGRPLPLPQPPRRSRYSRRWLWLIPIGLFGMLALAMLAGVLLVGLAYGRGILPGVSVGGIHLAGLDEAQAARALYVGLERVSLRDGERRWVSGRDALGLALDTQATAARAYAEGRSAGNALAAFLGRVAITPVLSLNIDAARIELDRLAPQVLQAPADAGVALVNGRAEATPPRLGRALDVEATLRALVADPAAALTDGLPLVMTDVTPLIMDASPAAAQANLLLGSPLDLRVYDPVTGDSVIWSLPPQVWGAWLRAVSDASSPIGLALGLDDAALSGFLQAQAAASFDASRTIDIGAAVQSIQAALAAGRPDQGTVIVKHGPRTHTVRAGETITSIAWDYGIPYLYIQQANNGLSSLSAGQTITIPPADTFLKLPVVPHKRIVVSISQQRTRVYENGALLYDWAASTGIADSPTWPGVYQVLLRESNAYAGNWDLWMPYFIGVYQPVPGAEFTNGFHGFPTRGGGQLLWANSLGRRVTYGCILLSNENARWLFDWAEEGTVVQIVP